MVVLNSRDRYENVWIPDFCTSTNHYRTGFSNLRKCIGTAAIITLYVRTYVRIPLLNKANTLTF